jgi:hypothetical protein
VVVASRVILILCDVTLAGAAALIPDRSGQGAPGRKAP